MTRYQFVLAGILVVWPLVITGLLFLMAHIEHSITHEDAETPRAAGLEPVREAQHQKEVRIFVGDRRVTSPD